MQARRPLATAPPLLALALAMAASAGCRNEMYDQPKYESLELNTYFDDGASARPIVAGTVARIEPTGEPRDRLYFTGRLLESGEFTDEIPFRATRDDLERGQDRYRIYCKPCHGLLGDGKGMIVERGFSPPPSFHSAEIREKPLGHYFDVITNGHGAMYSYASRIPPHDRWLISAYLRALQLSQGAPVDQLSASDRQKLDESDREANTPKAAPEGEAEGREAHQ
jgi:mono/diheme cytochrome c family protein